MWCPTGSAGATRVRLTMITVSRSTRRFALAGGFALAITIAPTVVLVAGSHSGPASHSIADPVAAPKSSRVTPTARRAAYPSGPPAVIGGSPSAAAIIACHGIPGCLSYYVNNPGYVQVPQVDTTVRQSQ